MSELMDLQTLKERFFRQNLREGVQKIFAAQKEIAAQRIYSGSLRMSRNGNLMRTPSGRLRAALESPSYLIAPEGEGMRLEANVPVYIRFLDMKGKGNYRIYNRQIYGILYRETIEEIRYGFREWARNNFPAMLEEAGKVK